jgi:uncharacterized protein YbaR (Trm112 family)
VPVAADLLEILVCPETRQPLQLAPSDLLASLNQRVSEQKLKNRGGELVTKSITEGLLRKDGRVLYVVDDGIPVMLIEESIEL